MVLSYFLQNPVTTTYCSLQVQTSVVANCCWALAVLEYRDLSFMQLAFEHVAEAERKRQAAIEARRHQQQGAGGGRGEARSGAQRQRADIDASWPSSGPAELVDPELIGVWAGGKPMPRIREKMQLLQAALWLEGLGACPAARQVLQGLPLNVLAKARAVWQGSAASATTVSFMQREVFSGLQQHLALLPKVSQGI